MIDNNSLNAQVPKSHTTAILQDETIIHSGMLADCKDRWNELPFYQNHGLYSFVVKAIDSKWYLSSWMQI